jgi:D-alanyl-D-alanine carboxypeptidase/D-alanyl-D-alanine-endopeptidase (penicillin-binding protein 4)
MKPVFVLLVVLFALPGRGGQASPVKGKRAETRPAKTGPAKIKQVLAQGKPGAKKNVSPAPKPVCKVVAGPKAKPPLTVLANEAAKPAADDPERERIRQLQEALDGIVRGKVLGRLRVGIRVEDLANGRVLYGRRSSTLMDPASNQKVLATTTALLRLGSTYRYRTEVTGAAPEQDGQVRGDLVIRGNGDPSLRSRHIDALAEEIAIQGVTSVAGKILADPRRIGSDEASASGRPPLRVGSTFIEVRVRPGDRSGARPWVVVSPASDTFTVVNQAETSAKGKSRVKVSLERAGEHIQVVVSGKAAIARGEVVVRRDIPNHALFAAILLRHALIQQGIEVHGGAGLYSDDGRRRVASRQKIDGALMALGQLGSDTVRPLLSGEALPPVEMLALHESEPLPILIRRVNKNSDNEWAERVLETVGAEVYGGSPSTAKGVRVLREALSELGIPASAYLPANGSGLGHQNRVTPAGMVELLSRLYFDPRIGPELMQSLSVGGVDGTTRNRFYGSSAAHRVRAKTGTLTGVSCLSGYVGDGPDVLAFSILVEGHKHRGVASVRAAQVSAVNAMMHFAHHAVQSLPVDEAVPGADFETGSETDETDGALPETGDNVGDGHQPDSKEAPADKLRQ